MALGTIIRSFSSVTTVPSGLAFDGLYLWNADMWGNKIYKLDVNTGYPVYEFGAPGTYPRGLSWDGEYFWCIATDTYNNEHIYKVTPEGAVTSEFPAPFDTYGLEIQH